MAHMDSTAVGEVPPAKLLGTYLNDHFAGASGGVDLARRLAKQHRSSTAGPALAALASEIAEDRTTLLGIMAALKVPVRRYKVVLGRAAEKAARLKPNARVIQRSPLSTVIELEVMRLGVQGKLMGWQALHAWAAALGHLDTDRLKDLTERAIKQSELLEDLRIQAVRKVFTP